MQQAALLAGACVALVTGARLGVARALGAGALRVTDVVQISGGDLAGVVGDQVDHLALVACAGAAPERSCQPIPFQIDERDATGHWALDRGPQPNFDQPPGAFDDNDVLLFMAADAGARAHAADLPPHTTAVEVSIQDPLTGVVRWVYLLAVAGAAPRAERTYVRYDPAADRVYGKRVSLGFRHGVPGVLALRQNGDGPAGANLLDRFKVRASATFLWGLIHLSRNEDDLSTDFVGWRAGPIRVIRRQRQRVRLGWGIRSPTFGSYTYFYRDFAELPVGLYLNFPPTYFFGDIRIRAILDFRDLRGWSLLLPARAAPIPIDGVMTPEKEAINELPASWFALRGPDVTLLQMLEVGASLSSVRRRLLYREDGAAAEPPEDVPGEEPGIGYQLDRWDDVGAGAHQLASVSYALPNDIDVGQFVDAHKWPLRVQVHAVTAAAGPPAARARVGAAALR